MARVRSIITLEGTLGGITHVNSLTYGKHARQSRGTLKPAPVNDAFKKSSVEMVRANDYSKSVKGALNPILGNLKDGRLWNRLNSHFRKTLKLCPATALRKLEGFQVSKDYSLERILSSTTKVSYDPSLSEGLVVSLRFCTPMFPGVEYINGYQITIAALYAGEDQLISFSDSVALPITKLSLTNREETTLCVRLKVPEDFKTLLLCIKCEGTQDGLVSYNQRAKGMKIVKVIEAFDLGCCTTKS